MAMALASARAQGIEYIGACAYIYIKILFCCDGAQYSSRLALPTALIPIWVVRSAFLARFRLTRGVCGRLPRVTASVCSFVFPSREASCLAKRG